ncbi:CPA1 family monovalent cation:H+ antiporter [Planomicrobium koreense]|uniref:CPA1 family monovalent cation:H+ antiporter n=1 Tax=Planococcus koreensis TaxID=112331 RepID=A0A7W8FUC1_9BACL|nr:sodium:proton antiporter [Planococcus koreensis]MBB5180445.1 CPA1 family monovalent cation:H+ antiporter [Planococcus koreensis]
MITHQILLLLLIGYVVYTVDLKKKYFPVPVVLVLIGLGLSFIPAFSSVNLSKDTIFHVFLPALLFVGAYQFPLKQLKENLGIITALSTLGLLATAVLSGFSIYWASSFFMPLSLAGAFLLAAILIPTDPVSVTSILKESTGAEGIADVVEGESMVNDGTSIVLFTIFLAMYETGNGFSAGKFFVEFLSVSLGGIASGLVLGWILSKIIHFTHHKQYQVMLSIITAYGGFYAAEVIGVSGVLATVVTGIMLSYEISRTAEAHEIKDSLDGFWDIITPTLLSVLFLLIGIRAASYLDFPEWGFAAIIFILTLIARFLMLGGFIYAVPAWRNEFTNDFKTISLITWSGIKGSMSIALVLWLEEGASGEAGLLVSLSFAVILMSLVIQSIGIYPLAKLMKNT